MIDDLEPTWPRIIFRFPARSPINGDVETKPGLTHMHLMVPRGAYIRVRPLDEPRVECQPHPCWDVAGCNIVVSFPGQVLRPEIFCRVIKDCAALALNDWIGMKIEEGILHFTPILSPYGAAYPIHYLRPSRQAGSPSLLWAGATGPAELFHSRPGGGGDAGPLRARWFSWSRRHPPLDLVADRETASPTP